MVNVDGDIILKRLPDTRVVIYYYHYHRWCIADFGFSGKGLVGLINACFQYIRYAVDFYKVFQNYKFNTCMKNKGW